MLRLQSAWALSRQMPILECHRSNGYATRPRTKPKPCTWTGRSKPGDVFKRHFPRGSRRRSDDVYDGSICNRQSQALLFIDSHTLGMGRRIRSIGLGCRRWMGKWCLIQRQRMGECSLIQPTLVRRRWTRHARWSYPSMRHHYFYEQTYACIETNER